MKSYWIIFLLLLSFITLRAQNVIKVLKDFVLIDTDVGIGQVDDEVLIQRKTYQGRVNVGRIKLLKFYNGRAAGKIVNEEKPYRIRKGDFVGGQYRSEDFDKLIEDWIFLDQERTYDILKVVSEYVLIAASSEIFKKNDVVQIQRKTRNGLIDVGSVKIIKSEKGKTAARIVRENKPLYIQVSDFVCAKKSKKNFVIGGKSEQDIDYYFFGSFKSE